MRLAYDVETDGFLEHLTVIHSLVMQDVDTMQVWTCCDHDYTPKNPDYIKLSIAEGLELLEKATLRIHLNGLKFDNKAVQKVHGQHLLQKGADFDLLIASRLKFTSLRDMDYKRLKNRKKFPHYQHFPKHLAGRHSLEAWGFRLGKWKGDYSVVCKAKGIDPWAKWNPDMQEYCEQDIDVTTTMFLMFDAMSNFPTDALEMEQRFLLEMLDMEANGAYFDVPSALELYSELSAAREERRNACYGLFPDWWAPGPIKWRANKSTVTVKTTAYRKLDHLPDITVPRFGKNGRRLKDYVGPPKCHYESGAVYTPITWTSFNPGSNPHVSDRLMAKYGWEPTEWTDGGKKGEPQPKIDDDILRDLVFPEAKIIAEFLMVNKRISMLAEGKGAWLKKVGDDGFIHGQIDPFGTGTHRCSHKNPNLGQVPKVKSDKTGVLKGLAGGWGYECRALFTAPPGKVMVGADASGLQLRNLAHYLGKYDGGHYAEILLSGDIHSANQEAAGLPSRDMAKTFIYAFLFGAGNTKIGSIIQKGAQAGGKLRGKFLRAFPAVDKVIQALEKHVKKYGYIPGLDGRHIRCKSARLALNYLLQSAEAIIMKRALYIAVTETLPAAELTKHEHWWLALNVHDEIQAYVLPGCEEAFGAAIVEAIKKAGEYYDFRCPLDGEAKVGKNWAETH